jgi:hypothetical protein
VAFDSRGAFEEEKTVSTRAVVILWTIIIAAALIAYLIVAIGASGLSDK